MATRRVTTEQRLLDAVFEDEAADAPRLAWADWLTAQGNPWGEVVRTAVDLAARGKRPSRALVDAQREHRAAGLGPLAQLFDDQEAVTFERGTVTGGALRHGLAGDATGDPRWSGVRWLHMIRSDDSLGLFRGARLDRLADLRNLPLGQLPELSALPLAARLRSLSLYAYKEHLPLVSPTLLEPFTSIEQLSLSDLSDVSDEDDTDVGPVHGWVFRSRRARAQLRQLAGLPSLQLATVLRQAARFERLEAVRFDSLELVFTSRGAQLFFFGTSSWLEEQITAMPIEPGAISSIAIDARILERRKNGRASMKALASHLGARLTIHAKPTFRDHLARWDGESAGPRVTGVAVRP